MKRPGIFPRSEKVPHSLPLIVSRASIHAKHFAYFSFASYDHPTWLASLSKMTVVNYPNLAYNSLHPELALPTFASMSVLRRGHLPTPSPC